MENEMNGTSLGYEVVKKEAVIFRALENEKADHDYFNQLREIHGGGWGIGNVEDHYYPEKERGYMALHVAADEGKVEDIENLLALGVDVNKQDDYGCTPLHVAAEKDHEEAAQLLLAGGAKVNAKCHFGYTPLHTAAYKGNLTVVELLLKKEANVNVKTIAGQTPLHLAVQCVEPEVAELLLKFGADRSLKDDSGMTAWDHAQEYTEKLEKSLTKEEVLHYAAKNGYAQVIPELMAKGVDVNAMDEYRKTPLEIAFSNGRDEFAKILIQNGAIEGYGEMKREKEKEQIERKWQGRKMGESLLEATRLGDAEKVLELIAGGAHVNIQDELGMTAISIAGSRDDKEVFRVLYENGADVNIRDDDGWTAFMHISANGPLLHEEYSDIMDEVDIKKAEKMGNMELAEELKRAKAEKMSWEDMQIAGCEAKMKEQERVNQKNENGLTLLHKAKSVEEAKELLEKGAEVNARDNRGRTPLHWAVGDSKADVKKIVQALLKHGADANIQDNKGNTPLHLAAEKGDTEVVKVLVSAGADAKIVNKNGETPLHMAQMAMDRNRDGSHHETIQLLNGLSEESRQTNKMTWFFRM